MSGANATTYVFRSSIEVNPTESYSTPGSETFVTPGVYSFTVPKGCSLGVSLNGAGGSGGSGYYGGGAGSEGGDYGQGGGGGGGSSYVISSATNVTEITGAGAPAEGNGSVSLSW